MLDVNIEKALELVEKALVLTDQLDLTRRQTSLDGVVRSPG